MEDRHIIWSNENLDLDDWREDLQEQYPDCSEDELYRIMCETNADYLSDERVNLNIQLSQPILVIADLDLWNGRRMGYKEIPSGNIRDCLSGGYDYTTWYVDKKGDFRCDDIHHLMRSIHSFAALLSASEICGGLMKDIWSNRN